MWRRDLSGLKLDMEAGFSCGMISMDLARAIYGAGSYSGEKLSSNICDRDWFWPCARFESLVKLQSRLPEVDIGIEDLPIWNFRNGVYSYSETRELLREKQPVVDWWKVVWFSLAIPRHSFLLWLVFRDALVTKEKMCKWGYAWQYGIACVYFVEEGKKAGIIYFSNAVSAASVEGVNDFLFNLYSVWQKLEKLKRRQNREGNEKKGRTQVSQRTTSLLISLHNFGYKIHQYIG
jgi:hypothetical protein